MEPAVEFLWWRECPSWERALTIVREEMERAGLPAAHLRVAEVNDEAAAERLGFPGSPTIRVRGEDIDPPGPDTPIGLTCRVYRRADGRVSPLPDPERVRSALAALADEQGKCR
ncbi:MAG TPA: hypothetical protein VKA89_00590 [Solirubrobacterales bacterium]|nr:hypothetical protein [Solirubrobacterales bacterium]